MDDDLNHIRTTIALHVVVAVAIGYLSVVISRIYGDWISILLGLVILWGIGKVSNKIVGKKGFKWWFSNGIFIYLFTWLISWIVFFNLI